LKTNFGISTGGRFSIDPKPSAVKINLNENTTHHALTIGIAVDSQLFYATFRLTHTYTITNFSTNHRSIGLRLQVHNAWWRNIDKQSNCLVLLIDWMKWPLTVNEQFFQKTNAHISKRAVLLIRRHAKSLHRRYKFQSSESQKYKY